MEDKKLNTESKEYIKDGIKEEIRSERAAERVAKDTDPSKFTAADVEMSPRRKNGLTEQWRALPVKTRKFIIGLLVFLLLMGFISHFRTVHMYRNAPVVGTWTYDYSIAYDGDENWTRDDFEQENSDMAIDIKLKFKDDGKFVMKLNGKKIEGTWKPDKEDDTMFTLSSEDEAFDGIMEENIAWLEPEYHTLVFSVVKAYTTDDLRKLFRQGEDYIDVCLKSNGTKHGDHGLVDGGGE